MEGSNTNHLDEIIKGKPAAPIGTKKLIAGRMYIKTADGWKYFGKGGGAKAKEHSGSVKGFKEESKGGEAKAEKPESSKGSSKKEDEETNVHSLEEKKIGAEKKSFDINKRFAAFETFAKAVIQGKSKSLIAYGSGGVGKTYTVTREMERAGKTAFDEDKHEPGGNNYDYVKITGKATPTAVYKALFEHNGKIIVFDDCDSVLQNEDAVNLFKGALDTSGDGTISYSSAKKIKDASGEEIPQRFKFTGRVIFISNLSSDEMPQPLKSRALRVDLTMDKAQTIERIRNIATDKKGKYQNLKFPGVDDYSHEDLAEVFDYLEEHKDHISDLNVRTVGSMLVIKQMADAAGDADWKEHAEHMIFSKSESSEEYDGSQIMKARRIQMAKSYGIDFEKAKSIRSSDIRSEEYISAEELEKS